MVVTDIPWSDCIHVQGILLQKKVASFGAINVTPNSLFKDKTLEQIIGVIAKSACA